MREITIGGSLYTLTATPFTLWIYRDEFSEPGAKKADILADLFGSMSQFAKLGIDPTKVEEVDLAVLVGRVDLAELMSIFYPVVQAAWAMCKTSVYPANFPGFKAWLHDIGEADLFMLLRPVLEEAQRGFFRSAAPATQAGQAAD